MATNFDGYLNGKRDISTEKGRNSKKSTSSNDSGYESLSNTPSLPKRDYANSEHETVLGVSQCNFCPKSFNLAYNLRSHLRTHTDKGSFVCTVCAKRFFDQQELNRHEGLHSGEKAFVCKGELKQDGQWGCGRRFACADALGQHFCSEAGRICLKPLLDEERRWQERQGNKRNIRDSQELSSPFPKDEPGIYTLPAIVQAQYPALATLNWSELPTIDDGYDGGPSQSSSFDLNSAEYYSDTEAGYTALQTGIKVEISKEPAAASPSKEHDTNTCLGRDYVIRISKKSTPKDSANDNAEPPAIREFKKEAQLVLDNTASFSPSAASSDEEINIKLEPLSNSAEPSTEVFTKVSELVEDVAKEPNPISNNSRMESPLRNEVLGDYDCLSAASSTESDLEDNESSEAEITSSETLFQSSFISLVLETYKKDTVESLMTEFKALLDHSSEVQSRATSTGSPNSSSPPRSYAEQSSQQGVSGRGKRKERDEDGAGSSRDDGDDRRHKKARVKGPAQDFSSRKFACPYYRRNPQKHKKHRSCAGPGWMSVHRVKEHVLRQHCLPIHCHRCCTIFKSETKLAGHQRLRQGCDIVDIEPPDGYNKEQEKLLRKRKRGLGSEEDKWKDMFKCLFPDDDQDTIPTPYYDDEEVADWESRRDDEFDQFEQYLNRELPRRVRRQLEQVVSESARPLESELRSQLVDIVRDAQSELFRSYRQTSTPRRSSALPEQEESETDQDQMDGLNVQDPSPALDYSAFCPPPPVADSYSNPLEGDISMSMLEITAGTYQQTSDSGYGSNNASFNGSGGGLGGHESGTNGDFPIFFDGEAASLPSSQSYYSNLQLWYQ